MFQALEAYLNDMIDHNIISKDDNRYHKQSHFHCYHLAFLDSDQKDQCMEDVVVMNISHC